MIYKKLKQKPLSLIIKEFVYVILNLVLFFVITVVILITSFFFSKNDYEIESTINGKGFENWLFITIFQIVILGIAVWRIYKNREEIKQWKSEKRNFSLFYLVSIGVLSGIGIWIFGYLQNIAVYNLFGDLISTSYPWAKFISYPLNEKILLFITGVLLIPITEELFFREMMFGNFLRNGFPKIGFIFSCCIFAVYHFDFVNILTYLVYGAVFAFLYQKTRSILTSIIAHFILNLIALSFLFY